MIVRLGGSDDPRAAPASGKADAPAMPSAKRIAAESGVPTTAVPGTGGWENYRRQQVGTLDLSAGDNRLTVRPGGPVKQALFDLRDIEAPGGGVYVDEDGDEALRIEGDGRRQRAVGEADRGAQALEALAEVDRQALARVVIDDRQRTDSPSVEQCIGHKIHAPDLIDRPHELLGLTQPCGLVSARAQPHRNPHAARYFPGDPGVRLGARSRADRRTHQHRLRRR